MPEEMGPSLEDLGLDPAEAEKLLKQAQAEDVLRKQTRRMSQNRNYNSPPEPINKHLVGTEQLSPDPSEDE